MAEQLLPAEHLARMAQPVLASASLDVPGGTFTCVTGPSGSGKSTLLSLLVRLADPDSGWITVGGRDISRIPLAHLRDLVSLVPQDPWLHTGTIAENIAYGRPGAAPAQVIAAADRAGVAAFARALLRDTPVLLLDEPTAGLDPVTEARLIDELLDCTAGKTVILVTHQPQLTARADHLIRVENGRLLTADLARSA